MKLRAILAAVALLPTLSLAQQFSLIESRLGSPDRSGSKDVCNAYLANLNAKPVNVDYVDCGRPVNHGYDDFRKPEWKSVDPSRYVTLIRKLDQAYFHKPSSVDAEEVRTSGLQKAVNDKKVLLYVTRIDINADGSEETLVKYERGGSCDNDSPRRVKESGSRIFVVNEALSDLAGPSRDGIFLIPGVRHDAFIYRGQPYFDYISRAEGPDKPKLIVQKIGRRSRPVTACIFAYNPNGKR